MDIQPFQFGFLLRYRWVTPISAHGEMISTWAMRNVVQRMPCWKHTHHVGWNIDLGLSENRLYSQLYYSHLIGIMISKTIGKMGYTIFRHTHLDAFHPVSSICFFCCSKSKVGRLALSNHLWCPKIDLKFDVKSWHSHSTSFSHGYSPLTNPNSTSSWSFLSQMHPMPMISVFFFPTFSTNVINRNRKPLPLVGLLRFFMIFPKF